MRRAAVFLDRDDTLIRCGDVTPDGDLGDPGLVELLPGVEEGCGALRRAGYALIVVSNQGGVARGKYGLEDVRRVNERLNALVGGVIEAFYVCPWHPRGVVPEFTREHPWRKPKPGMLLQAAKDLGLDLGRSWLIGDAPRDVQAGRAAGCRTVLIGRCPAEPDAAPDLVVADFHAATQAILRESSA